MKPEQPNSSETKIDPRWKWHNRELMRLKGLILGKLEERQRAMNASLAESHKDPADTAADETERDVLFAELGMEKRPTPQPMRRSATSSLPNWGWRRIRFRRSKSRSTGFELEPTGSARRRGNRSPLTGFEPSPGHGSARRPRPPAQVRAWSDRFRSGLHRIAAA